MKAQCKNPQLAGINVVLPAVFAIEGKRCDTAKRLNIIVGFAAGGAGSIVAAAAGQWLSQLCHRHFVEVGRGADGDLAAEAFYDKLASVFPDDSPFVAVLVPQHRASRVLDGDVLSRLPGGAGLARWKFGGPVRAYLNPATGVAQLTFNQLPGGITLASRAEFDASISRAFERCHDAGAWYGFGVPMCEPAKAVMTLRDEFAGLRGARMATPAAAHA
jgi:hypothetical protein